MNHSICLDNLYLPSVVKYYKYGKVVEHLDLVNSPYIYYARLKSCYHKSESELTKSDFIVVPMQDVESVVTTDPVNIYSNSHIFERTLNMVESILIKKLNDTLIQCIINAGLSRNIILHDKTAKRLLYLMKTVARRNGLSTITDFMLSPKGKAETLDWACRVNIIEVDKFSVGHEYQEYFSKEIVAGINLSMDENVVIAIPEGYEPSLEIWGDKCTAKVRCGVLVQENAVLLGSF